MKHKNFFKIVGKGKTADGKEVEILDFDTKAAAADIAEWAAHVRRHYCEDGEIEALRKGTGLSRTDFLKQNVLPSAPNIVSGEFAEILVADYIQYRLGWSVPRVRYFFKINPNVAVNGVDIVAFKRSASDPKLDQLSTCEVKAALSNQHNGTLQNAIDDAGGKDPLRLPITLSAFKQRLLRGGDKKKAEEVERFQDRTGRPYVLKTEATAVHCTTTWKPVVVTGASCAAFPSAQFVLRVIKGDKMMDLARALYKAACA